MFFVNDGLGYLLKLLQPLWNAGSPPDNLTLILFENNYTVVQTTNWGNLTEATFSGYARQSLQSWATPAFNSATNQWSVTEVPRSFVSTAAGPTVYGWGIVADIPATNQLLMAANFPSPITIPGAGTVVGPILPSIIDQDLS